MIPSSDDSCMFPFFVNLCCPGSILGARRQPPKDLCPHLYSPPSSVVTRPPASVSTTTPAQVSQGLSSYSQYASTMPLYAGAEVPGRGSERPQAGAQGKVMSGGMQEQPQEHSTHNSCVPVDVPAPSLPNNQCHPKLAIFRPDRWKLPPPTTCFTHRRQRGQGRRTPPPAAAHPAPCPSVSGRTPCSAARLPRGHNQSPSPACLQRGWGDQSTRGSEHTNKGSEHTNKGIRAH